MPNDKAAGASWLMRPGVVTCKPQATLGQVASILIENRIHALFVVGADGKIKGIITDFDLLAGEWLSGDPESLSAMRRMTAGDLMSSPVNSIEASAPAKQAAQRMQERVVRRLLVTENGKPVGVISVSDIIASIAEKAVSKRETVADVMSDVFLTCRDQTPLASAAQAMTLTGWRSVLVVDASGKPLGVVSGLDLLAYCDAEGECGKVVVAECNAPSNYHKYGCHTARCGSQADREPPSPPGCDRSGSAERRPIGHHLLF